MSDLMEQPSGDSAAVVDEVETATPDTTVETQEAERQFDENGLPIEAAPVDDDIEEEVDGVKLRGKKDALEKWKGERLMQADYTRKTQEAAEIRKQAESERATYQQATAVHQQLGAEIGELRLIDARLEQLRSLNSPQLVDQDPVQALRLHTEMTQLQARRGQVWNSATQKDQQLRAFNESENSKRTSAAEAVVMREIKDWGPEKYRALQEFAEAKGVDKEGLRQMLVNVPKSAAILQDAMKWRQLEQQRAKKPPAAPVQPVTRLSGTGAVSTKEPAQMSDSEFAAWRKRQIAQRK
jgi:hypothetical protein